MDHQTAHLGDCTFRKVLLRDLTPEGATRDCLALGHRCHHKETHTCAGLTDLNHGEGHWLVDRTALERRVYLSELAGAPK
jgi:hypothetical protein